jgi:hypothetical protein
MLSAVVASGITTGGRDMMLKTGFLALIAVVAMTSAATADCRIMGFRFYVTQNDSVSTTGVSTGGSNCSMAISSLSSVVYTSAAVVSPPGHGTLTELRAYRFRYKRKPDFGEPTGTPFAFAARA